MQIRQARLDDLARVVDLWSREGGPTSVASGLEDVRQLLTHDAEALLLAFVDDSLMGSLIVGWDGWRCHVYRLVVEPKARRAGIASALLAEARARAVRLGAPKIDATVAINNESAIAFWKSHGFARDPHDGHWSVRI